MTVGGLLTADEPHPHLIHENGRVQEEEFQHTSVPFCSKTNYIAPLSYHKIHTRSPQVLQYIHRDISTKSSHTDAPK